MSFAKMIAVVDEDVLLRPEVLFDHLLDTIDPWTDLVLTEGVLDVLDHSAPDPLYGGKLGLDATERVPGERARGEPRFSPYRSEAEIREVLRDLDRGFISFRMAATGRRTPLLLLGIDKKWKSSKYYRDMLERSPQLTREGVIVLFDDIDLTDSSLCLWKFFNNVDPLRDIWIAERQLIIDATKKGLVDGHDREWPDEIVMAPEVTRSVRERAHSLGVEDLYP